MKSLLSIKSLAILSLAVSLTACGAHPGAVQLPDDETQEVPSTTPNEAIPEAPASAAVSEPVATDISTQAAILAKYDYLDPNNLISDKLLKAAVLYYDANKANIKNTRYLSVIDFSLYSGKKRFFVIDMNSGSVWAIRTAHGKGSDANHDGYAEKFSNVSGSNATSLGVYKTAETYSGAHGLSLRLDGLSSTNSNARSRAIVVHGADYVQESNVIQGRSWGCPAVAMENRDKLISLIKGGSVIYAGLGN